MEFVYAPGQTPLDPDEMGGLKAKHICWRQPKTRPLGVRRISWTGYAVMPRLPVLDSAQSAKRDLDSFLVVPTNV